MPKIQLVDHLERLGNYGESRDGGRMSGAILMMSAFKKNFQITKGTFLAEIKQDLEKETTAETPLESKIRLAVCLYRLARGDYLHTVAELTGLGTSTVCEIVKEDESLSIQENPG